MSIADQLKEYRYEKDGKEYHVKITGSGIILLEASSGSWFSTGATTAMKRIDFLHDKLKRNGWTVTKK